MKARISKDKSVEAIGLDIVHVPVMFDEVMKAMDGKKGEIFIDCTFGGGGHTRGLLERGCTVVAIDRDVQAGRYAEALASKGYPIWFYNRVFSQLGHIHQQWMWEYVNSTVKVGRGIVEIGEAGNDERIELGRAAEREDYSEYFEEKAQLIESMIANGRIKQPQIAGILADFGICTHQLYNKRGFSFKHNDPLDMRMGRSKIKASDILRQYSEEALADLFFFLSDEKQSRLIARKIVALRAKKPITHMYDLLQLFPEQHSSMHPATKVLQALRIEVNQELKEIHQLLEAAHCLKQEKSFKLACISFHSGEDRIVKNMFSSWVKENNNIGKNDPKDIKYENISNERFEQYSNRCKLLTKKPIEPTEEEIRRNPASRSAKLRVCELSGSSD